MTLQAGSSSSTTSTMGSFDKHSEPRATIGKAVAIKGEISGNEDILIEGAVEGLINLKQNSVTVAKGGKVNANIHGLILLIEGDVTGDLFGTERVIIRSSGKVHGNITAPKVSIEEGARVRGSLNTDVDEAAVKAADTHEMPAVQRTTDEPLITSKKGMGSNGKSASLI